MDFEKQGSVFDVNPAENKDYQHKLSEWVKKLELSKLLFNGKDPQRSAKHLAEIDDLIAGIRETIDKGIGILDLPKDTQFKQHLSIIQLTADKLPSKIQAKSLKDHLEKKAKEKEEGFRRNGSFTKPIETLDDIPGFERTPQFDLCEKIGMDFSIALETANKVRLLYLENDVYDISQRHKLMSKDMPSFPGAALSRLANDVSQHLKGDKRSDESWRITRISENCQEVGGVDFTMLHPDKLEETRKLAFKGDQKTMDKIASRKAESNSPGI